MKKLKIKPIYLIYIYLNKNKKLPFIVLIIAYFAYFIIQFSSVYPPLEKYKIQIKQIELNEKIEPLNESENINLIITDTTGNYPEYFNIYCTILKEDNLEYRIKYLFKNNISTELDLLGAYENKIGGYRKSDSKNIEKLIVKFENEILNKIKN